MYEATPAERVTVSPVGSVEPETTTLDVNPAEDTRKRAPSATALPDASVAVNVTVTFSPAVGVAFENESATVVAVYAPTWTATVDVIVAAVQAEVLQIEIVDLPDFMPVTRPAAETVATDESEVV